MTRLTVSAIVVVVTLLVQASVINRVWQQSALDLVLAAVVCLSVILGAYHGTILGFVAGLIVDLAPPADTLIGHHALVYCLVGFFAGRAGERSNHPIIAGALIAFAGVMLDAAVGAVLGEPQVTMAGFAQVVPVALLWTALAVPLMLWLVIRLAGRTPVRAVR